MRDKILSFIKEKGPIVPIDLASFLRMDSLIVSAYLSELVSNKLIKISSIKLGTSPLYYLPNQKKSLESFISKSGEQEKLIFEELKNKKILREENMSPVLRVAIKNLKDFAIPLEVSFQDKKEVFWKWYELSNEEASPLIKDKLYGTEEQKIDVERKVEKINEKLKLVVESEKLENLKKEEISLKDSEIKKKIESKEILLSKEKQEKEVKNEVKNEEERIEKEIKRKNEKEENVSEKNIAEFTDDKFAIKIIHQLKKRNVKISSLEVEKKNSELNLIIEVPTGVGEVTFYCKAKDKKRLNDTDIAGAFAEGYLKKLPSLLVSTGVLTKKGQERLEKDFKSVVFLSI